MKTSILTTFLLLSLSAPFLAHADEDNLCYLTSNLTQGDDGNSGCWITLSSDLNCSIETFVYDCKENYRTDAQAVELAELQAGEQNRIAERQYVEKVRERQAKIDGYRNELSNYNSAMQSCLNSGFTQESCNLQLKDFDNSTQEYGVPNAPRMPALPLPEEVTVDPTDMVFRTNISVTENLKDRALKFQQARAKAHQLVRVGYCATVINETGWN